MSKTKKQPTQQKNAFVRWMIRRDMPEVLAIEESAFQFAWSEEGFIRCLRQRNCIGMIAEINERIVGYFIYEIHRTRIHLLNMAVHVGYRHQGVGRKMIEKLISKLSTQRRDRITLEVRERNVDAQLFLRCMGFKALAVLRDFYEDTDEDAFLFQYRLT